jgi:hypothetical protein
MTTYKYLSIALLHNTKKHSCTPWIRAYYFHTHNSSKRNEIKVCFLLRFVGICSSNDTVSTLKTFQQLNRIKYVSIMIPVKCFRCKWFHHFIAINELMIIIAFRNVSNIKYFYKPSQFVPLKPSWQEQS